METIPTVIVARIQYISVPEKLIEQYEARLLEKDEVITLLKEKIAGLE